MNLGLIFKSHQGCLFNLHEPLIFEPFFVKDKISKDNLPAPATASRKKRRAWEEIKMFPPLVFIVVEFEPEPPVAVLERLFQEPCFIIYFMVHRPQGHFGS